jgi:hypothetical protein
LEESNRFRNCLGPEIFEGWWNHLRLSLVQGAFRELRAWNRHGRFGARERSRFCPERDFGRHHSAI